MLSVEQRCSFGLALMAGWEKSLHLWRQLIDSAFVRLVIDVSDRVNAGTRLLSQRRERQKIFEKLATLASPRGRGI